MPHLLWDASGLTKRCALEAGTDTANALFAVAPAFPMLTTYLGYSGTCASLRRKMNRGDMTALAFTQARIALRQEVFLSSDFHLLSVDDAAALIGVTFIDQDNLNSSDSMILAAFLRYTRSVSETCVLLAADGRLVKAATAEGQRALSSEAVSAAGVPAFLATL